MRYKLPIQIIELEDDNFHLIVLSEFSQGESGRWIVDTGASKTVFDENLKNNYFLPVENGGLIHTAGIIDIPVKTKVASMKPFFFGKLLVKNLQVALIDLSHINKLYSGAANIQVCGLLGGDFLMKYNAIVDYRKRILLLENTEKRFKIPRK